MEGCGEKPHLSSFDMGFCSSDFPRSHLCRCQHTGGRHLADQADGRVPLERVCTLRASLPRNLHGKLPICLMNVSFPRSLPAFPNSTSSLISSQEAWCSSPFQEKYVTSESRVYKLKFSSSNSVCAGGHSQDLMPLSALLGATSSVY